MRLKNCVFFDNMTIYKSAFHDLKGFCSDLLGDALDNINHGIPQSATH